MRGDIGDGLLVLAIHLEHAGDFLFAVAHARVDQAVAVHDRAQPLGMVGDDFGHDILRALDGVLCGGHALFLGDVVFRLGKERLLRDLLRQNQVGQRREPALDRHRGARLFLLLVGAVDILDLGQSPGLRERLCNLVRHLALLGDRGGHLRLALLQIVEIGQPVVELAQNLIVAVAGQLLAVTGDKRNGIPLFDQRNDIVDVALLEFKFLRQLYSNVHKNNSLYCKRYLFRPNANSYSGQTRFVISDQAQILFLRSESRGSIQKKNLVGLEGKVRFPLCSARK